MRKIVCVVRAERRMRAKKQQERRNWIETNKKKKKTKKKEMGRIGGRKKKRNKNGFGDGKSKKYQPTFSIISHFVIYFAAELFHASHAVKLQLLGPSIIHFTICHSVVLFLRLGRPFLLLLLLSISFYTFFFFSATGCNVSK